PPPPARCARARPEPAPRSPRATAHGPALPPGWRRAPPVPPPSPSQPVDLVHARRARTLPSPRSSERGPDRGNMSTCLHVGKTIKRLHLGRAQPSYPAGRQVPQPDRADGRSDQPDDGVTGRGEHASNDLIAPLVQNDLDAARSTGGVHHGEAVH